MFRWILSFCTKLRGKPGVFKRVHDKLISLSLSLSSDTIKVEPVLSGTVLGHPVLRGRFSKSINFSPDFPPELKGHLKWNHSVEAMNNF